MAGKDQRSRAGDSGGLRSSTPANPDSGQKRAVARRDWMLAGLVFLVSVAAFINGIRGEWVYDDKLQILSNPLVYEAGNAWKAISSDVWAYRSKELAGAPGGAYWRPVFMMQMVLQHRLFGFDHQEFWHAANYFLHGLVSALAYFLLRRLRVGPFVAFGAACLFAVHPVHVESVTWISGSPDLLMGIGLLLGGICAATLASRNTVLAWSGLLVGYLCAIGAKEIGIFGPLVAAAVVWACRRDERPGEAAISTLSRAFQVAFPGLAIVLVFLIARDSIAKEVSQVDDVATEKTMLLSAPQIASFYVKQCFWPWESLFSIHAPGFPDVAGGVAPGHPQRPVTAARVDVWTFWIPLAMSAVMGLLMLWSARRSRLGLVGLTIFVLILGPALYIRIFPPDHTVRDRYLYVPLLGMIMMVLSLLGVGRAPALGAERPAKSRDAASPAATVGRLDAGWVAMALPLALVALCVPLMLKTIRYNRIWSSESRLWEAAVRADPNSSHALVEVAIMRFRENKLEEALELYTRALDRDMRVMGLLGRAGVLSKLERYSEAEFDALRAVQATRGKPEDADVLQCYRVLCRILEKQNKLEGPTGAIGFYREARNRFPAVAVGLTDDIVRLLMQSKKLDDARVELDRVLPTLPKEPSREAALLNFRMAQLNAETSRTGDAITHFKRFLQLSDSLAPEPSMDALRVQVRDWLSKAEPAAAP